MESISQATGEQRVAVSSNRLLDAFWVLLHPAYWLQNHSYSAEWDEELTRLMESETFREYDGYEAKLGKHRVWVTNHPYASFVLQPMQVRPRRSTINRAHQKMMRDLIASNIPDSTQ
jgi:hypothetical protein